MFRRKRILRNYSDTRSSIQDGDILLFCGTWWMSRAIEWCTNSPYSHAGMAGWWGPKVMCIEMLQSTGGRAVALSKYVSTYPGAVDVYRPIVTPEQAAGALEAMKELTSTPYGWLPLFRAGIRQIPFMANIVPPARNLNGIAKYPFCSAAITRAYHAVGVDLVKGKEDCDTSPADLSRAPMLQYVASLTTEIVP